MASRRATNDTPPPIRRVSAPTPTGRSTPSISPSGPYEERTMWLCLTCPYFSYD
jgi:hypothetical protein